MSTNATVQVRRKADEEDRPRYREPYETGHDLDRALKRLRSKLNGEGFFEEQRWRHRFQTTRQRAKAKRGRRTGPGKKPKRHDHPEAR